VIVVHDGAAGQFHANATLMYHKVSSFFMNTVNYQYFSYYNPKSGSGCCDVFCSDISTLTAVGPTKSRQLL
jgi:hypothetical protein